MLETIYQFTLEDEKAIEKLLDDEQALINHMVFPKDEGLPEHKANSNVYFIIVRGQLSLRLGEQETQLYSRGHIVNVPYGTSMLVQNKHHEILEFFVVKAPNPRAYKEI